MVILVLFILAVIIAASILSYIDLAKETPYYRFLDAGLKDTIHGEE